jgi:hypothetical protein
MWRGLLRTQLCHRQRRRIIGKFHGIDQRLPFRERYREGAVENIPCGCRVDGFDLWCPYMSGGIPFPYQGA